MSGHALTAAPLGLQLVGRWVAPRRILPVCQRPLLLVCLASWLPLPLPPLTLRGAAQDPLLCGLHRLLVDGIGVRLGAGPRLQGVLCRRASTDGVAVGPCWWRRGLGIVVVVGEIGLLGPPHGLGVTQGPQGEEGDGVEGEGSRPLTF